MGVTFRLDWIVDDEESPFGEYALLYFWSSENTCLESRHDDLRDALGALEALIGNLEE